MTDANAKAASAPHGAIVLVDDDKFLLDMYGIKFTQAGFDVHTCASTEESLKLLREGLSPKAVVFDIIMPEGDGFYLLDSIQNEHLAKGAALIALTNEMSAEEEQRAMGLGATKYMVKATLIPSEVVNSVIEEVQKK